MTTRNPLRPRPDVRKMRPTQKHRPAIWECMLGTVYASDGKKVKYFDYGYEAALRYAGVAAGSDPRLYKVDGTVSRAWAGSEPSKGRLVLWIVPGEAA